MTARARGIAAGAAIIALWIAAFALSRLGRGPGMLGNYASILFAPLLFLYAAAIGEFLLERVLRCKDIPHGKLILSIALGVGAISLATFLSGLFFILSDWMAIVIVLATSMVWRQAQIVADIYERIARFLSERNFVSAALIAIVLFIAALNTTRAFVPPLDYDELEYHLAAPAKYMHEGHIVFISDNAYASFPQNVEMLFLDAMILRGGVEDSFALGRLINTGLGLCAAGAVGVCAAAMFHPLAALPAVAIFYTWPAINHVTHIAYVELGLILFATLAMLTAFEYRRSGRRSNYVALLGILCGLAAGVKYPAVLFVCLPAGLWVLFVGARRAIVHALIYTALALAVFSPWLIRNFVNTGNPVYPLAGRILDGADWSARKDARWQNAHSPKGFSLEHSEEQWRRL